MVTNKIIKGRSNAKGNKNTQQSNANDHGHYNQNHGTKGKSKGKGNGHMEDNAIKASQKKNPKGWSDIQHWEPSFNQAGQHGCAEQAQEDGQ